MDVIYADLSVSMSSFKKHPAEVLRNAGGKPVAVLTHDRLAFYIVPPRLFEAIIEEIGDSDLVALARKRLAGNDTAIEVGIDEV